MSECPYDYVDQAISLSLECPICRSPFVEPIMPRACQHLFCSSCLYRALDLSPTCPIDRTRVKNRREDLVEAPRVIHELLGELKVKCTACRDEVTREGWDRHVSKCRGSGRQRAVEEAQEGIALPAHGDSSVPGSGENETQCEICEEGVLERDWNDHVESCSKHSRPCRYCSEPFPTAFHAAHILETCPLAPIPCPHVAYGCPYVGPRENLSSDHLYSECPYEPLKDCFERFKTREREWEAENWQLRGKVEALESRLEDVEGLLDDTKHSLGSYFAPANRGDSERSMPSAPPLAQTVANLSSRNTTLSTSLNTLTQSHTDSLHTTQHLVEELNSMRSVIGGMRMQMGDLMRTVQYLSSSVPGGANREYAGGFGFAAAGDAGAIARKGMRPNFGSRRSDSSSDEPDNDPYPDVVEDRYLSSSATSDPDEDLLMFTSPGPFSSRTGPFPRPLPHSMPINSHAYGHLPLNRSSWTSGFDYGTGAGGGGAGPPSLFSFGSGPYPPRPIHPGVGYSERRNGGRISRGIGGGMKL